MVEFMHVEFENLEEVRNVIAKNFPKLLKDFDENFMTGLALVTWRRIRKKAPRLTGELKKKIKKRQVEDWDWIISSEAPHAFALEFGVTRRRIGRGPRKGEIIDVEFPAQPYFFKVVNYQIKYLHIKLRNFIRGWRYKLELK